MQEPDKLLNWKYIVFVGLQTLNFTLFYVGFPVIPKYAVSIGYTIAEAGFIAGVLPIAALLTRPISGYSIDHYDRKRTMLATLIICGLSIAAFPLTDKWILLIILRVIYGASFSFFSMILVSCATDYIPKRNMAEGVSYFGLGVAIAAAIGPPIGLGINASLGARALFFIMGGLTILSAVIVFFVPVVKKEVSKAKERISVHNFIEKKVILYAILVIPFTFSMGFINSFFALTAEARHIQGYSIFFTVFAVAMMVLKPISGKVQDKFGLAPVLIPALALTALGLGIISIGQTLLVMIVAALLLAFGQGSGQPALLATCVSTADYARRGVALSTYYIGLDFGNGIGNIAGSGVASALGYKGAYLLCSALLVAGLIVFIIHEFIIKRRNHKHEETI